MGQVNVTVHGRQYTIGCEDGEEAHIAYLAEYVDGRAQQLTGTLGAAAGEARLMLMTALLVADDLATAFDEVEAMKAELGALQTQGQRARDVAPKYRDLARRFEAVAALLRIP